MTSGEQLIDLVYITDVVRDADITDVLRIGDDITTLKIDNILVGGTI